MTDKHENTSGSSSETDSSDDEMDNATGTSLNRTRRSVGAVNIKCVCPVVYVSKIKWPPETKNWREHLKKVDFGRTRSGCSRGGEYGNKMQLFCRRNYFLAIYPDGKVRGTMDDKDLHTHVELIGTEDTGHLRIRGLLTNMYVAMNSKGRVYAEVCNKPLMSDENTIFIESFEGLYNTYLSQQYAFKGWYLAINKAGKLKNGKRTKPRQKACHFLPRRKLFEQ